MFLHHKTILFSLAAAFSLSAAPAIKTIQNAASNLAFSAPLAQGSVFVIQGSGLGPATLTVSPSPFQNTTLANTSIAVTVGGTTVNALMYYTSDKQVAGLLPSNTPTGTGSFTVTYNGQTSAPLNHGIAASNVGLFTVDSSGSGPGIVTYPDYSLVSPVRAANCGGPYTTCGAANPGDTLVLWGTGIGPVNGDDASGAGLGQNRPDIPLTVWLGGVQASVTYQGRSGCCIGEDQIIFTVPNNVPAGCSVPLAVQIGNLVSNTVLMPVANGSRSCPIVTPALSSLTSDQMQQAVAAGPISFGSIRLAHFSDGGPFEDDAKFQFLKVTSYVSGSLPFFASWVDNPPLNTYTVYANLNENLSNPFTNLSVLDAGSSFVVSGPAGSVTLGSNAGGLTKFNSTGAFLVPGPYTITGTGGAEVGSFSGSVTIPAPATLTSPANGATVTRANGLNVTWTGGNGTVELEVNSAINNAGTVGSAAVCTAPASAGAFTIPGYVLDALPAGSSAGLVLSSQSEGSFTANGLVVGTIETYSNASGFGFGWGSGGLTLK